MKVERLAALQAVLAAQQAAFNQACEGRDLAVLFDRPGRRAGQLIGRSPYMQPVHADAPSHLYGRIASVRIERTHPVALHGRLNGDFVHAA